jgi:hypothetical protein
MSEQVLENADGRRRFPVSPLVGNGRHEAVAAFGFHIGGRAKENCPRHSALSEDVAL